VCPGDHVIVRGRLPRNGQLGRLFIFASANGSSFSPYALNAIADVIEPGGAPRMLTPLSLRLVGAHVARQLSFVADIDGLICVMQEIDSKDDPLVRVRLIRIVDPNLGWRDWIKRRFAPWLNWKQQLLHQ
jgi:hypothetical protein